MSHLIKKQCPKCASIGKDNHQDNLTIYPDKSQYCFSCGYFVPKQNSNFYKKPKNNFYKIPTDSNTNYPTNYSNYLTKYLTKDEIKFNLILWSKSYSRLIFPIINHNCYLGRSLTQQPKWKFYGQKKNLFYLLGNINSNQIIITEDIISAIIIGRQNICTIPLFGSFLSTPFLQTLKNQYNKTKFILWLDKDKENTSLQYCYTFKQLNFNISFISTDKDPKEYPNEEIKTIITNAINN